MCLCEYLYMCVCMCMHQFLLRGQKMVLGVLCLSQGSSVYHSLPTVSLWTPGSSQLSLKAASPSHPYVSAPSQLRLQSLQGHPTCFVGAITFSSHSADPFALPNFPVHPSLLLQWLLWFLEAGYCFFWEASLCNSLCSETPNLPASASRVLGYSPEPPPPGFWVYFNSQ